MCARAFSGDKGHHSLRTQKCVCGPKDNISAGKPRATSTADPLAWTPVSSLKGKQRPGSSAQSRAPPQWTLPSSEARKLTGLFQCKGSAKCSCGPACYKQTFTGTRPRLLISVPSPVTSVLQRQSWGVTRECMVHVPKIFTIWSLQEKSEWPLSLHKKYLHR